MIFTWFYLFSKIFYLGKCLFDLKIERRLATTILYWNLRILISIYPSPPQSLAFQSKEFERMLLLYKSGRIVVRERWLLEDRRLNFFHQHFRWICSCALLNCRCQIRKRERDKVGGSTGYPSYCLQVVDTDAHLAHLVNNPLKGEMGLLDENDDSERGKKGPFAKHKSRIMN